MLHIIIEVQNVRSIETTRA